MKEAFLAKTFFLAMGRKLKVFGEIFSVYLRSTILNPLWLLFILFGKFSLLQMANY